jgi:cell division transport system permease protein
MLNRIDFTISEAFQALRRNPPLTLAAITTVSVALFLLGAFGYLYFRADGYAKTLPSQLEMRVYAKDGATEDDVSRLGRELNALNGVKQVTFLPKAAAWNSWREAHPEIPGDLANPLPDGYTVTFTGVGAIPEAVKVAEANRTVEKVIYERELAKALSNGLHLLRYVGYFGILLLVIAGVVTYNAIRFTIIARRTEVRIMQLVGASGSTIRTPFVLEGLVQGLLGGLLAALLLQGCDSALSTYLRSLSLSMPSFPVAIMLGILGAAGAVLGVFCSSIAIRVPLGRS